MKFFHVYNEECFKGLEKNGLLNKDSGFKIQHAFSVPEKRKFNQIAAKGGDLYNLIKEGKIPFYVDRIAGGITWHNYNFDKDLIRTYEELLGDWFLGFQLHESGSNRRNSDWPGMIRRMKGNKGPYNVDELKANSSRPSAVMPDGTVLYAFSQGTPEYYANMRYAETYAEYMEEMKNLFRDRMNDVDGKILPCDSYYMATKLQDEMGMTTFMPEVGCQIPLMRQAVSLARGIAKAAGKTWGTYYECWRANKDEDNKTYYTMPCFNSDRSNEWYLSQEMHGDDFTSFGVNGGSSRLLQDRIYHYALMSGAHYFSEEWGLNCSYTDMKEFTLSHYGQVKKDFINTALTLQGIKAHVPFAIVLPKNYACMELPDIFDEHIFHVYRDVYMRSPLSASEKDYFGHIENVLKLIFIQKNPIGNEGHVITNSRFADVFDIIYEDTDPKAFANYAYLIDATKEGTFAKAQAASGLKILESADLDKLEHELTTLIKETMPCFADDLCWLVSTDENGQRYLSLFNNEGNERCLKRGNVIHSEADARVKVTFKEPVTPSLVTSGCDPVKLERVDDCTYYATIPAAGFGIFKF